MHISFYQCLKRKKVCKERKLFLFKKEKLIIKRKKHRMLFIYAGFRPRIKRNICTFGLRLAKGEM
jgi:hypothetical protein